MNIEELTKGDIGNWVSYTGGEGEPESGRIKSWNDKYIFVVFNCGDDWINFQQYTGKACKPEDLCTFRKEGIRMDFETLLNNDVMIGADDFLDQKGDKAVYLSFPNLQTDQKELETWKDILPIPERANFSIFYDDVENKIIVQFYWREKNGKST